MLFFLSFLFSDCAPTDENPFLDDTDEAMNPFSDDAASPPGELGEEVKGGKEQGENGEKGEKEDREEEERKEEREGREQEEQKEQKEQEERKEQVIEPTDIENRDPRPKGSKGRQHATTTAQENRQENSKMGKKKEKQKEKNKKVLAVKSTNQRLRQPTPPEQPPEFEVVVPAKRSSPVPVAKRTRPSTPKEPAGAHGKSEAVGSQKPDNRNKLRRVSPSSMPLRRLSAGIGMGVSMLSSPFSSPVAAAASSAAAAATATVPTQSKTRKKGTCRPIAAAASNVHGSASVVQVIPVGDVDQVIDPRNPHVEAALLGSSPPTMAWLKVKASGVVSGARKAADRLLKARGVGSSSGGRTKGYALLDGKPPTLPKKKNKRKQQQQENLKIGSNNDDKKQLDTKITLPTIEENSFGELIDNDISFNSFLLRDDEDELSLPNGSYVVNYDNGDTVITAAVTRLEDGGKEGAEPLSESPLAQFTPGISWDLKRKKGVEFLRGTPTGMIGDEQIDSPSGRSSPSAVYEVDDELLDHYNHIFGKHGPKTHPRNTQGGKKVVKKMAMENLRKPTPPAARPGAGYKGLREGFQDTVTKS